ncbi:hypothetical protein IHE44_0015022 [Lamprotornis superbus]|uniref:E3 ubiquitin-protein ligase RNF220 n=1 Tax=Lamprotornis superbus TaxID=245042 RepID=A0A835NSP0_9PASS|nr:hypothetical protein IHE44_0015022 [Lamprotornis superbus]
MAAKTNFSLDTRAICGSGFIMCSGKENPDSDADLDVDGDDTLEYGKPQYTEADIIPCTGEEPGEAKEREALRGAVLNGGTPSTRITPEFSKWASDEMPSTSNGECSKQETMQKTCKNSDIEKTIVSHLVLPAAVPVVVDQFISAGAGSAASMIYGTEHCSQPLHESLQLFGVSPKANRARPLSIDYDELSMGRDMTSLWRLLNGVIQTRRIRVLRRKIVESSCIQHEVKAKQRANSFSIIPSASVGRVACTQPSPVRGTWLSDPHSTLALPCKNSAHGCSQLCPGKHTKGAHTRGNPEGVPKIAAAGRVAPKRCLSLGYKQQVDAYEVIITKSIPPTLIVQDPYSVTHAVVRITEDSAVTTFEALKARVRELERQLSRGDRYKCLICMDSYTMPLTSIQCWHVHCEECWLRTLGAKKLCPQCNTITSPGDLRRIYL